MSANALARTFGDSARSYDRHAQIQLAVNRSLLAMLPEVDINGWALDIGAGTAPVARPLQQRYPQARWLALDISEPMLAEAQARGRFDEHWQPLCADAEALPLADASVALVYSNFALQWSRTPSAALAEIERVLAPGAEALVAVPVAGTLKEFSQSWQQVDQGKHFNALPSAEDWQAAAAQSGLVMLHQQRLQLVEHYADVRAVATMLKATGAWHVQRSEAPGLMTPRRYAALVNAYEQLREPRGLPVSWHVTFMHLQRT